MNAADSALVRRRARNLLVFAPLAALTVGIGATQFVAYRLSYNTALGSPIVAHAYWPWSFVAWWLAPWEPQVDSTFQYLKFGLLLTACLGAVMALKARQKQPRPQPDIHGTAGFADEGEIKKSSLFPRGRPGIVVGGWTDPKGALHYLTDAGEGHVIGLGATRAGKTMGMLIPTLLSYPESMIVNDPKGEIWRQTAGWRAREAGNVVMRFAPADMENTVAWNAFHRVRVGTPYVFRDVSNIVSQIADPQGKGFVVGDHWEPSGANFMNGVALYLVHEGRCSAGAILSEIDRTAGGVPPPELRGQRWINPPGGPNETLLSEMARHPVQQIAEVGSGMLATASRERASIISTARRQLALYRDPIIAKNTSHSDFRIEDLVSRGRPPVTVYIETRGEDELRLRPLVRLFISVALGQLISGDGPNERALIAAIDEVPSLRRMEPLEVFLTKAAGANVRVLLLAQDYQDIVDEYGEHERITGSCGVLSAHAPNNDRSADWLSHRTGQSTVVIEEVSETIGNDGRRTHNRSYRSVLRPVMTPDEIKRMRQPMRDAQDRIVEPGEMLIFQAGHHVIRGTQALAFLNPEFRRRMAIPAPPTMRSVVS